MYVYVINQHGQPLMPCRPQKARVLLKEGKASLLCLRKKKDWIYGYQNLERYKSKQGLCSNKKAETHKYQYCAGGKEKGDSSHG